VYVAVTKRVKQKEERSTADQKGLRLEPETKKVEENRLQEKTKGEKTPARDDKQKQMAGLRKNENKLEVEKPPQETKAREKTRKIQPEQKKKPEVCVTKVGRGKSESTDSEPNRQKYQRKHENARTKAKERTRLAKEKVKADDAEERKLMERFKVILYGDVWCMIRCLVCDTVMYDVFPW